MAFEYDRCLHYNGDVRDSFVLGQQFGMNTRTRRMYRVEHVTYDSAYILDADFNIKFPEGRSTVYLKFATEEDFLRWNPQAATAMSASAKTQKDIGSNSSTRTKRASKRR